MANKKAAALSPKQEAFCQAVAAGNTQADAYRAAYNAAKMKDTTIHNKASLLAAKGEVRARIDELKATVIASATKGTVATAEEVLQEMTAIAMGAKKYKGYTNGGRPFDKEPIVAERIRALENLGKYHGLFAANGQAFEEENTCGVIILPEVNWDEPAPDNET